MIKRITTEEIQKLGAAAATGAIATRVNAAHLRGRGKHSYASAHQAEASKDRGYAVDTDELNDAMVTRVLRIIQAEAATGNVDIDDGNIAAVVGKRLYVAYLTNAAQAAA